MGVVALTLALAKNGVEGRCGYPELPINATIVDVELYHENREYFEDRTILKIVCKDQLIGIRSNDDDDGSHNRSMQISSEHSIKCHNSRWNATDLICLQKVSFNVLNIKLNWNQSDAIDEREHLIDHNVKSCLNFRLNETADSDIVERVVSVGIRDEQRISRIVLMINDMDPTEVTGTIYTKTGPGFFGAQILDTPDVVPNYNLDKVFNGTLFDTESNDDTSFMNETIFEDGTESMMETDSINYLQMEQSKRFFDFVYENEFQNHFHSMQLQMFTDKETMESGEKMFQNHKHLITERYEMNISVVLSDRRCRLTNNANIADILVKSEVLVFDCPMISMGKSDTGITINVTVRWINRTIEENEFNTIRLCGMEALAISESECGKPYVPIYGKVKLMESNQTGIITAQYECGPNHIPTNVSVGDESKNNKKPLERVCALETRRWEPSNEDIFCTPKVTCLKSPPNPDPSRFYIEIVKMDYMQHPIGGQTVATIRCLMLSDIVVPFTFYSCGMDGEWLKYGKWNETELKGMTEEIPKCRTTLANRHRHGGQTGVHYYHHHYYQYKEKPENHTTIYLFGRSLNDNKYIIYYGVGGLILLFGGSFIILFHVRRMAKKISNQMRERSYMATEKGALSDQFLPISDGGFGSINNNNNNNINDDGIENLPPYYQSNDENYYDTNRTMFSNDLPPPATPISMPMSSHGNGKVSDKSRLNLASNFDSIKF